MIRHIVWWRLKPKAEGRSAAENGARIKERGEGLMGKIPGLTAIEISCAIKESATVDAELVLFSTHPSMEDLKAYTVHPLHQELVKIIQACTEGRQALDYEI